MSERKKVLFLCALADIENGRAEVALAQIRNSLGDAAQVDNPSESWWKTQREMAGGWPIMPAAVARLAYKNAIVLETECGGMAKATGEIIMAFRAARKYTAVWRGGKLVRVTGVVRSEAEDWKLDYWRAVTEG